MLIDILASYLHYIFADSAQIKFINDKGPFIYKKTVEEE